MEANQIIGRMETYLHTAAFLLSSWLKRWLPKTSENWWEECVIDNLSYPQLERATERGYTKLDDFDLAALLRITDRSWYELGNVTYLKNRERDCIKDMRQVRNNWAHLSTELPGKDVIVKDLETLKEFFEMTQADIHLINEVENMKEEVSAPSFEESSLSDEEVSVLEEESGPEEEIKEKSLIYLVGEPSARGVVISVSDIDDTKKYEVFVNGEFKVFYSGQIAPAEEKKEYKWVDIDTFRSYLTAYQINNPSGKDLYSLNSARIDFVPYQFRPALKIIHSDEPRILIADSVGVGKTIEAGLIIKELQARKELENILVICPKPLVAEHKWENEMKRFDEDFVSVNGEQLRQILSDTDRDGEWPLRYARTIIPYSILDSRTYNGESGKKKHSFGLKDLDPAPHFDLVIVDEAHHIRNGSMEKEKAFEYKCVKYFCDHADAAVMLTATPLQTSDNDLFTLLNVLRPDLVIDKETFDMMSKPNSYISRCSSIIRASKEGWQEKALNELNKLLSTQWGENVIAPNPAYSSLIETLHQENVSREERVKMITDVESLHSFNSMLNRTRRKDIQDFCIRRSYTLAVEFTAEQKVLHDELLSFEVRALTELHGNARSISFMMTTIKRQAASCIFGLAPHIRDLVNRRFSQMEEDSVYSDISLEGTDWDSLRRLAEDLLLRADNLPSEDPKFDMMMEAVEGKQKEDNNKIMIFSTFRYTLYYLRKKIEETGLRVGQIDGSVKESERLELRNRFEKPKEDKDALDILLFTEVGSEGLDYQFCNMMINYDLPWNPMKIEQRIGRIDRRGQKSEHVDIYNMVTNGTVDAEIYYRCLMRIGIFERSIGECDEILGEIATQIDQIASDPNLTEEEQKEKLEQMADNEVRKMQEMDKLEEEEKEFFGLDLSEYMTAQEIKNAENPWLTPTNIQNLVEQYLSGRLGPGNYFVGEGEVKQLRLKAEARGKLREDFQKLSGPRNTVKQEWDNFLKGTRPIHPITFDPEAAEKNRDAFFITAVHPLAKQAAEYCVLNEETLIHISYNSDLIDKGTYRFSVYAWKYMGLDPHFRLVTVCEDDRIAKELSDILQEATTGKDLKNYDISDWEELEKKQLKFWQKEKKEALAEAGTVAASKIESLSNNFKNRQRSLIQKIKDTSSESIRRMYQSELDTAEEKYRKEKESIEQKLEQTDIHTELIANGILEVMN